MLQRSRLILLLAMFVWAVGGIEAQPMLRLEENGPTITVEASSDLKAWQVVTNVNPAGKQLFVRGTATEALPFNFLYEDKALRDAPGFLGMIRTNYSEPLPDTSPYLDETGVRMYKAADGKIYNHPELQAEYGLLMVEGYYNTTNQAYLDRAILHAQRILDQKVESRGAWYYPMPFNVQMAGYPSTNDLVQAPWWCGLGQGVALSLFVRLYRITHDPIYEEAMRRTFLSLTLPYVGGEPWAVEVDDQGFLWFEEYAKDPSNPQYVFNGHMFVIIGLFDYFQQTADTNAMRLVQGGLATVKNNFDFFRTSNWIVKYSKKHPVHNPNYQVTVERLLNALYVISGDTFIAKAVDMLVADWPNYTIVSGGTFSGGLNAAQFDDVGKITNSISILLAAPTFYQVNSRQTMFEQPGTWLRLNSGDLTNYWVQENPRFAVMKCVFQPTLFWPPRKIVLRQGLRENFPLAWTFYKYTPKNGAIENSITKTFSVDTEFQFDADATINSQPHVRIFGGELGGYWVPVTTRSILD